VPVAIEIIKNCCGTDKTSEELIDIKNRLEELENKAAQTILTQTYANERQLGSKTEQKQLEFNDAVYGGAKGFVDRHYVFKGFQNSEEFNEYLQILMEWERDSSEAAEASSIPTQN
jgi:hypothetical protein